MCESPEKVSSSGTEGGRDGGRGDEEEQAREREKVMQLFAAVQVAFSEDSERREVCTFLSSLCILLCRNLYSTYSGQASKLSLYLTVIPLINIVPASLLPGVVLQ